MKTIRVILVVFLAVTLSPSVFAQLQTMSTQQLTEQSSAVLLGTCEQTESYWSEGNSKIFTRVRVHGEQYLKGNLGSEAEITIPGGRIGNTIYEVTDMPVFRQGEQVLVFLWNHPSGKQLVIGGAQGKFSIEVDKATGKKVAVGAQLKVQPTASLQKSAPQTATVEKKVFLDDFLGEVKSYIK